MKPSLNVNMSDIHLNYPLVQPMICFSCETCTQKQVTNLNGNKLTHHP